MQLLLIRHAIAEDYAKFVLTGQSDELRPLTAKGEEKMRKGVKGLRSMFSTMHRITSSPLRRAAQTADLLAETFSEAQRDILPALAPSGSLPLILNYLQERATPNHIIALIGHEPDLGKLATWLLSGHADLWLPFKKGGGCLLEFAEEIAPGQAELAWVLTSTQLRKLGKA